MENINKIDVSGLSLYYAQFQELRDVTISFKERHITSLIGPSGCGKSTLLRCLNRMNDLIDTCNITGEIKLDGVNIYQPHTDVDALRRRVGMVFQRPNPFPLSVFDNVAYGLRVHGICDNSTVAGIVEESLKSAWLWNDLKDKLQKDATTLPLDQQQRLCIARLIAIKPEVILMDEPCSALDPISTSKVEELMFELKKDFTIVIVTHNMQQAARASDYCGFMLLGDLIEFNQTGLIFTNPANQRTQDYITGRFG
jgi:phosphate transport system ATP-binding protein